MNLKRGEIERARQETDEGFQRYPSEEREWHWRFRILKAEILERQGLANESLQLLAQELPPSLTASDLAVRRKFTMALANARIQEWAAANRFLTEAEAIARPSHPELLGEVFLRKGVVDFFAGKTASAKTAYQTALIIARERQDRFLEASALGGLGLIATRQEHYDESIDWSQASVQLARSVGAERSSGRTIGNMAWCYRKLGDFENALALYNQAIEVSARNGLVADRIYWLTGVSNVYYEQRDYRSAATVLTQALDLARSRGDKRTLTEYLNALAEIALETAQIDLAEKYYEEAARLEQGGQDRSQALASELVRARVAESKRDYAAAGESFRKVIEDPKADTSQRWEAEARLAKVYSEQGLGAKAEQEFRRSLERIETSRSSVRTEDLRLSFLSTAISFHDEYIEFLISQHRPEDALQVAELSRARTLAEGLGTAKKLSFPLRDFRPRQIAQQSKAVLLFYWLGQKKSYLWVITPAKLSCLMLPGATQIDPLVKSYREVVLSGRDVLETRNVEGTRLYNILVEPARKLIPQGSRMIVLPDGTLYSLNFETLLVSEPKPHFWIEDVTVSTASSLTLLSVGGRASSGTASSLPARVDALQLASNGAGIGGRGQQQDAGVIFGNLLLVGNATQANPEFPVLRQAEIEMERVQHYFPESGREILAGPQATPAAFLASKPEKFAYVHFVAHGTASRAHPLDSAVILSPQDDSFKLYAREIVKHPLSAYLVTLSACNGSGIRAYSGEGLVGLSWAFLRAGAHNVIAALWEVSDTSTPQLMDRLYRELSRGQDPASALRMAKLSLLKSDSVFKKPFYWAPFQLYSGS